MSETMDIFTGELLGTMTLVLLGNGVVSNVVYKNSKGNKGGWIAITTGWALAVYMGVQVASVWGTGGHINPAASFANLVGGSITFTKFLIYVAAQFIGAMIGQVLVNGVYWQHTKENSSEEVLACHSTGPTHRKSLATSFFAEFIGTSVLIFLGLLSAKYFAKIGNIQFFGAFSIALVVFGIGLSLGGPTGYAINPARDLGPRIIYALTFKKGNADWKYSWVPVLAPLLAGGFIALLVQALPY